MSMLAVHLEKGRISLRRRPIPRRPAGYALIRMRCAGICNTDLELQRGYYGFKGIPGHEFVGEVVAADSLKWIGRRVVGEINLACGQCSWCRQGLGRHCPERKVLGIVRQPGVFAEYFVLPEANLHAIPREIPDDQAVFTEPLAAACEILDQVRIPPGTPVTVLGDGKLGLLIAQVLRVHGADVRLYGRHKQKLRLAEEFGIGASMVPAKLKAAYDLLIEATGSETGLQTAIRMARPRAVIVMKSTLHGTASVDTASVVVNEITMLGSRCGRFPPALRLLRRGRIRFDGMITARLPLSAASQAFTRAAGGALKVLLVPD